MILFSGIVSLKKVGFRKRHKLYLKQQTTTKQNDAFVAPSGEPKSIYNFTLTLALGDKFLQLLCSGFEENFLLESFLRTCLYLFSLFSRLKREISIFSPKERNKSFLFVFAPSLRLLSTITSPS